MAFRNKDNIQMVLLDLDGTLLNNEKKIGHLDIKTLQELGNLKVNRVFATGRNLYSALKVLPKTTPVDFLIFSCGAGIYDWTKKEIIFSSAIEKTVVVKILNELKEMNLNFSVHFPIPDNHKYFYYKGNNSSTDFEWRNSLYEGFNFELKNGYPYDSATQFIVILENIDDFNKTASKFPNMKIIRATSPIDGKSLWLEIFNNDVSKAKGGIFLCNLLQISKENTLSIGNDYNDLDLLNWTKYSYIVNNAPEKIKPSYLYCTDNENNPLNYVFKKHWC